MWGYLNGEVECPLIKIRFKEPKRTVHNEHLQPT